MVTDMTGWHRMIEGNRFSSSSKQTANDSSAYFFSAYFPIKF